VLPDQVRPLDPNFCPRLRPPLGIGAPSRRCPDELQLLLIRRGPLAAPSMFTALAIRRRFHRCDARGLAPTEDHPRQPAEAILL
jgi:hypothetical protein